MSGSTFLAFLLVNVSALPGYGQAGAQEEQLREATKRLHGGTEALVREGAQICRRLNSARSMDALLDVLKGDQPHYRDIVWEVMPDVTDPYARRAVENELVKDTRHAEIRQWCVELLGLFRDLTYAGSVEKALADKDVGVRRAAARSLGQLKHKAASKALLKTARDKDVFLRANSIEALARIDPEASKSIFLGGLGDADAGVRCALLGAIPETYPDLVEERSVAALADKDWRPRVQAVENLSAIRTKSAVEALIPACDDARPVVRHKAAAALQALTGMKWTLRTQWEKWWAESRDAFLFPEGKPKTSEPDPDQTAVLYHGLQVLSDHVAFLIDKSGEMEARLKDGRLKAAAAVAELDATLGRLQGNLVFNVFTYAEDAEPFLKSPVALDPKQRKGAVAFVSKAPNTGQKNIWGVLSEAISDPTLDTIYLLSSGEPQVGLYVHWNRVTAHLRDLNRFHKVVIHTVAYSDSEWYREQLEEIAKATGGSFTWVE